MDASNPYPEQEKEKKKNKQKAPKEEEENTYSRLNEEDDEEEDEDDPDDDGYDPDLDGDGEFDDDEIPWYKNPVALIGTGIVLVIVSLVVYFVFMREKPAPPPPPTEEIEEALDPTQQLKGELYKKGIGKEALDEKNIYEQGSIESSDFRRDFVNTDSPENYVLPINIVAVNDSVSYTKHRTQTDDGMDMYWADAMYKDKKTRFTVPYYIWQTLAPQGVMDVIAEVVTDADGRTFVTSITAVPPTEED